jgi:hypothetical protein
MDISEIKQIISSFKKMDIDELNNLYTTLCKTKKEKEAEYNDLLEQVFFIINELKKEIKSKSINDSDSESESEKELDNELDIRLIEVNSDEDD